MSVGGFHVNAETTPALLAHLTQHADHLAC